MAAKKKSDIKLRMMDINILIPSDYNPRDDLKPTDSKYKKLKKSILEYEYIDPIVWNERTNQIVGGHQSVMPPLVKTQF